MVRNGCVHHMVHAHVYILVPTSVTFHRHTERATDKRQACVIALLDRQTGASGYTTTAKNGRALLAAEQLDL